MHFSSTDFQAALLGWYRINKRDLPWRRTKDPYFIWVSEVMLQQTQVKTVIPYYHRFLDCFPHVAGLADAELASVLKLWEGLGYYSRARNFHRACRSIMREHDGKIPAAMDSFIKLPGVGDYIASAVLSLAFDLPYPVVDGNVKRVLARVFQIETPVNRSDAHKIFKEYAYKVFDTGHAGDYNQAIMELGALICKPRSPLCPTCPVSGFCGAFSAGNVQSYPKREKSKNVPTKHLVAGVVSKQNSRLLIVQRPENGLLGGLWEFPTGEMNSGESLEAACVRIVKTATCIDARIQSHLTQVRHAYSHFKVIMDVFLCHYEGGRVKLTGPSAYRWILHNQLTDLPIHKANLKFIPLL